MDRDRIAMQEILDNHAFTFYEISQTGLWDIDERGYLTDKNLQTLKKDYPHHLNNFQKFMDELSNKGWKNNSFEESVGDYITFLNTKVSIVKCKEEKYGLAIY